MVFLEIYDRPDAHKKKQTARLQEKAHHLFNRKKLQMFDAAIAPGIREFEALMVEGFQIHFAETKVLREHFYGLNHSLLPIFW